jgi:drug/metabolite transporter (DMT)-like permease
VASGAAWAGLDAIRKRLGGELSPLAILLGISAAGLPVYVVLGAAEAVAWLEAPAAARASFELDALLAWTLLALVVAVAANLLLIRALQLSPLSLTTPYLSFTPVATLLSGALLLGQMPAAAGLLGVAIVVVGAFVLNAGAGPAEDGRRERRGLGLHAIAREPGSRLALGVALLFALGNAIDRRAVLHGSEIVYAGLLTLLMTLALLVPRAPRAALRRQRRLLGWVALAGLVMSAAMLLQLFSFRFLFVAYADAMKRSGGNLVAVLFGAFFFGEGGWQRRLLAVAVMSVGVTLILLGA